MRWNAPKKTRDRVGCIAALILAAICLVAAASQLAIIMDLRANGVATDAQVTGFKIGARNSTWAIYSFKTLTDEAVTAQDRFQQYIRRVQRGDKIRVLYDPDDPTTVTADLGAWIWQGPAIFGSGFVLLVSIAVLIRRQ